MDESIQTRFTPENLLDRMPQDHKVLVCTTCTSTTRNRRNRRESTDVFLQMYHTISSVQVL
jgi:predicted metal-binding protein